MLIPLFIYTLDYFAEMPDAQFFLNVVINTLRLGGLENVLNLLFNTMAVQG